jgi:hypothetical protein
LAKRLHFRSKHLQLLLAITIVPCDRVLSSKKTELSVRITFCLSSRKAFSELAKKQFTDELTSL